MFGDCKIRDLILFKFNELEINEFLKEMKIPKIYQIQKIYYKYQGERPSFFIKIKEDEGKYVSYDVNLEIEDNTVKINHHYFNGEMLKNKKKKKKFKFLNRQLQIKRNIKLITNYIYLIYTRILIILTKRIFIFK